MDDVIGYMSKRVLLKSWGNCLVEREFSKKEKQIILEAILEFTGAVGVVDEYTNLIIENELEISDLI